MSAKRTPNKIEKLFSADDLKRIEEAVREAEKQTSGEIVPTVVSASDPYDDALWRAGVLFGVLALTVLVLIHRFSTSWEPLELAQIGLGTLAATLVGVLLTRFVEPAKRLFAGNDLMERRVAQRAAEAFLNDEVFNTRDRTGILIFISLLEHKVIVLGDSGINAKVQKSDWEGIVTTIVDGIRAGKPTDGLIEAVRQCGSLLKKQGLAVRPDDTDELGNTLRHGNS